MWWWIGCTPPDDAPDPPAETAPADTDAPADSDDAVVPDDTDSADDTDAVRPPEVLSGGFVDLSAALWAAGGWSVDPGTVSPFREVNYSHGLFVDLTGDGAPELLLQGLRSPTDDYPRTVVLRYAAGALEVAPALGARFAEPGHSVAAMLDVDGDGALDVVVSGAQASVEFGPVTRDWPDRDGEPGFVSAGLADLDRDGWLDVLGSGLGCAPGQPTWTPLLRTGARRFTAKPETVVTPGVDGGRLFSVGWLPARDLVVAPGMACPGTVARPVAWRREEAGGVVTWVGEEPTGPDAPYRADTGGQAVTALHPASATALDLDADGDLDLAMGSYLSRVLQWRDDGGATFTDVTDVEPIPVLLREGVGPTTDRMIPWGMAALDLDRDGVDDLVIQHGDDVGAWASGVPGTQRPVLWLRRGDGWREGLAGLPAAFEGRSMTVGDLDRDGRPDLVLGGAGELPRVLLNRIDGPPGVALRLVGTTSNPLGIGAVVRPEEGGWVGPARAVGHIVGPGPMSEGLVFLAAGSDGDLDAAEIRWPSGVVQRVGPLAGGQVHEVVEPATWTVEPSSRQAPADGASTVRVVITPRRADGSVDAGAAVSVAKVAGVGELIGAPVWTGSAWEAEVRAPTVAGELVLEITVDGVVWPLRPRVWWE